MSGTSEFRGHALWLASSALRASVLLTFATVMTGCGGGGNAPDKASQTHPPQTAGFATLFPGAEDGQDSDQEIDFPRADPGESTKVDVTVSNATDEPMKVETARLVGESPATSTEAPRINADDCEGQTLQPGETCHFALLIPSGAADAGFQIELKTDQGDVTAAVSSRGSNGETTTGPSATPQTSEPGTPTETSEPSTPTPLPPDTSAPTGPPTDQDTAPREVPSAFPT